MEDADDVAAFDRAVASDDGSRVPHEVVKAELDGAHPVRAWREYRKLTQTDLVVATGVSKAYISQAEAGQRVGTLDTLRAIARALDAPMDSLHADD